MDCSGAGSVIVRKAKKVKGRTIHQRPAAFDAATGHYVRIWIDHYGQRSGWLFPSWSKIEHRFVDQPLSNRRINRILKMCSDSAGISDVISGCHDLRRLFVTYWRQEHGNNHDNLLTLQVGHSDVKMTDHYDLTSFESVREAITSPLMFVNKHSINGS